MKKISLLFFTAALCFLLLASRSLRAQTTTPDTSIPLTVTPSSGTSYPSMQPIAFVEVFLGDVQIENAALVGAITKAEDAGWDCTKVSSYSVIEQSQNPGGKTIPIPISAIIQIKGPPGFPNGPSGTQVQSCNQRPTPGPVQVLLGASVKQGTNYVILLINGSKVIAVSKPFTFPTSTTASVSIVPQAVPAESLTNGATRDVGQLSVSYNAPYIGRTPLFLSTKDLFSTDEKDSKSAFSVTGGVGFGASRQWYLPVKLSETVQGNQVATSLSAVSGASISGMFPWHWTHKALNNDWIDAGIAPEFSLAAQYTRRINQVVTAKTKLLAENDASINPVLTIDPFFLFPRICKAYQSWLKPKPDPNNAAPATDATQSSKQFCLGVQIDLGAWYLPLDKTAAGSQQVEGYGDISFLIPLSNFNFTTFSVIQKDGLLNSQIRVEYSDAVNAANNYARTRQWTVGIEVIK